MFEPRSRGLLTVDRPAVLWRVVYHVGARPLVARFNEVSALSVCSKRLRLLQVFVELWFDAIDDHRGTLFRVPGDIEIDFRIDVSWHGAGMAEAVIGRPQIQVSASAVARRLKVARQTVNRWLRQYRQQGRAGLQQAGRAGRKPRLRAEQRQRLEALLLRGPEAVG